MLEHKRVNLTIALLIAICLWVYVLVVENPFTNESMRNVPVNFLNENTLEADGLVILEKETEAVTVNYSGQRSDTDAVKATDFKITADMEGLKEGENTVKLFVSGPQSVEVDGTSPQKIKVYVDKLANEERPVRVRIVNQTSDDSEPHIVQTSEDAVKVKGARTYVNQVSYVKAEIDASKVSSELKALNVKLLPVDKEGGIVENVQLETDAISVTTILHEKKTVTLNVPIKGNDDIYISREITAPKSITVKGTKEDLKTVTAIESKPIDVSQIFEDAWIPIVPILPENIEVAMNSEHLRVKVIAVDASSRIFEFTENDIVLEGVTESMIPVVENTLVKVKVSGHAAVIEGTELTDFSLSADVAGLGAGEHTVPLNCTSANNLLSVEYNPKEIKIVIKEKQTVETVPEGTPQEGKPGQIEHTGQNGEGTGHNQGEGEA